MAELQPRDIVVYTTETGRKPYGEWLASLTAEFRVIVGNRIDRVELGNFGDTKSLGDGVFELRFDVGPGYRVYYGLERRTVVLLLSGGDKKTQVKDIKRAKRYWHDHKKNTEENNNGEL